MRRAPEEEELPLDLLDAELLLHGTSEKSSSPVVNLFDNSLLLNDNFGGKCFYIRACHTADITCYDLCNP